MPTENETASEQKEGQRHPIVVQDQKTRPVALKEQGLDSLVARLRTGSRAAAEQLVGEYYHRIYLYLRQLGHSRQTSEDLTQEVFIKAWYHLGQLREGRALVSWLYRIAGNVSYQHRRRRSSREATDEDRMPLVADDEKGYGTQEDRVAHTEQLQRLQQTVEDLPWMLRQTIILHYMQGFPISGAAKVVGISEGTFKSRLNRALEVLRGKTR